MKNIESITYTVHERGGEEGRKDYMTVSGKQAKDFYADFCKYSNTSELKPGQYIPEIMITIDAIYTLEDYASMMHD